MGQRTWIDLDNIDRTSLENNKKLQKLTRYY